MGSMVKAEKKVLMVFDRTGSTLFKASAESTVEAAHIRAVRIAKISPSINVPRHIRKAVTERPIAVFSLINLVGTKEE